jgi:hypothetical protein
VLRIDRAFFSGLLLLQLRQNKMLTVTLKQRIKRLATFKYSHMHFDFVNSLFQQGIFPIVDMRQFSNYFFFLSPSLIDPSSSSNTPQYNISSRLFVEIEFETIIN